MTIQQQQQQHKTVPQHSICAPENRTTVLHVHTDSCNAHTHTHTVCITAHKRITHLNAGPELSVKELASPRRTILQHSGNTQKTNLDTKHQTVIHYKNLSDQTAQIDSSKKTKYRLTVWDRVA